jgi:hypothetical protein
MPPHLLRPPLLDAIRGELEKLLLDKVWSHLVLFGLVLRDICQ